MGKEVGVGMGAGNAGVTEAIKVGKVVGVSSVTAVDLEVQPKRATQTTGKSAKGIQSFMKESRPVAGLGYCSASLLTKASSSSLVETSPMMRALRSCSSNSPTRGP